MYFFTCINVLFNCFDYDLGDAIYFYSWPILHDTHVLKQANLNQGLNGIFLIVSVQSQYPTMTVDHSSSLIKLFSATNNLSLCSYLLVALFMIIPIFLLAFFVAICHPVARTTAGGVLSTPSTF